MSSDAREPFITSEEYLARERLTETKSEYYDGRIYEMSSARRPHIGEAHKLSRLPGHPIEDFMSTVAKKAYLTPEEYLAAERLAEFKSEYYDGQVYAMAGTSYRHWVISSNLLINLGQQLRGGPCRTGASELRLKTKTSATYMYPDLMVICGPPEFVEGVFDTVLNPTVLNPTVIIEVLSPSTEFWDRSGKLQRYQTIETLQEYVLVTQDRMLVEKYARQGDEWVFKSWKEPEDVLTLGSIDCRLDLSEIYNGVPFEPEPN